MKYRSCVVLLLASMSFFAQTKTDDLRLYDDFKPLSENNIFKTEGYYNWGASIIKGKKGTYHLFYSRWEKKYSFYGWLTHSEMAHATSKSTTGPWKFKEVVFRGRRGKYWDAITAHNPKIKYFERKYYLYYFGTNLGKKTYTEEGLVATVKTGYRHPNWKNTSSKYENRSCCF